jgi:hypothetical protein
MLTAFLVLVVEYQIALSCPVHNSEAVFTPGQSLGRQSISSGHPGYRPGAILLDAVLDPGLYSGRQLRLSHPFKFMFQFLELYATSAASRGIDLIDGDSTY